MASRSFGTQSTAKPHLVRGSGGLQGEIADLRGDVEAGFAAMEVETSGVAVAQANIRLNTQPTALDTITIGSDVYQFVAALGDQVGSNIGVLRGADAAAALANIISAINGTAGKGTTYSANGKVAVKASIYNTDYLHIEAADIAGGSPLGGPGPNVALADALTAAVNWDQTNLSLTGGNVAIKTAVHKVTVDANNLANNFDLVAPGKLVGSAVLLVTNAAGVPDTTGKAASITLTNVFARDAVTVDLDVGATDPVATDLVYVQVKYI